MTYLIRSNKKRKISILLIACIVVVVLLNIFNFSFVRNTVNTVSAPILKARHAVATPFVGFGSYFKEKKDLYNENNELKDQILDLKLKQLHYETLENENEILKESLGRQTDEYSIKPTYVLVKPPQSTYDTLTIDLGEKDVKAGDRVYYKNIYIGDITETYTGTSIVKLISSSGIETNVTLNASIDALAKGLGGGRFAITLPKDVEVSEGDAIVLPGFDGQVLSVVSSIENLEVESFQEIFFNFPFNLLDIDIVEVRAPKA